VGNEGKEELSRVRVLQYFGTSGGRKYEYMGGMTAQTMKKWKKEKTHRKESAFGS